MTIEPTAQAGTDATPATYELQAAIVAAALASGRTVLDAGRGQPNWLATVPRAGFFVLGSFAVAEADAAAGDALWGVPPPREGIAARLLGALDRDAGSPGAAFLTEAVRYGIDELGFEADAWVDELARGVLGAGYPSPTHMLHHLELVLERYLVTFTGIEGTRAELAGRPGPPRRRGGDVARRARRARRAPAALAREHGIVVLPGQIFDAETWDVRVSLASLTAAELSALGSAIVTVLDAVVVDRPA